jgi:hypothetical protein
MLGHRRQRERQIVTLLESAPRTIEGMVAAMYKGLDPRLHGAAGRSVLAHLIDLERQGRVARSGTYGRAFPDHRPTDRFRKRRSAPTASSPRAPALARVSALPWLLFLVVTVIAAWLAWRQFRPADIGDPLATSLIAFEKQDKHRVQRAARARGIERRRAAVRAGEIETGRGDSGARRLYDRAGSGGARPDEVGRREQDAVGAPAAAYRQPPQPRRGARNTCAKECGSRATRGTS